MNGAKSKPDRICILDPNNNDNDISGGSAKVMLIMQEFAKAHSALLNQMAYLERQSLANRKGASILGSVFAGDYKSFGYQRSHLRQMFERR